MLSLITAGTLSLALAASAASSVSTSNNKTKPSASSCRATLTVDDARALALQTPNARAFENNLNASLKAEVVGRHPDGSVVIRVTNTANKNEMVDLYTISLRDGHILDDAQEPAEDDQTVAAREKLIARHCKGQ